MSHEPVPVAVIGVGHLGSRHARVYADLPRADLVGVADVDLGRARAVGDLYGVQAVMDYRKLLPKVRAASVAVPTVNHHELVLELVAAGKDVLVEKPAAANVREAEEMVRAARSAERVLAVGHTERYNPAVEALLAQASDPRFIEVHRLSSFTPRSLDIDVVLDLMIHDLDIVASLVRSDLRSLDAVGVPVVTNRVDIANARLRFANGCVANLTASRVSQDRVRKLRVFEKDRYVSLDYQEQEALCYRLVRAPGSEPKIQRERLAAKRQEPLKRELEDFLDAVLGRKAPRVSGQDGVVALELAGSVLAAMKE
ncbi:MAG: Gfo/Idh/MocA family protein [Acidobacteriota bacterium]